MLYCLWRRRRYISSARLFADKKAWEQTLKDLGQVTAQEFLDTMELCGKGASMTEVLQNEAVPRRVKAALRTLNLCMNQVVGTNAHRTMLRHVGFGYRLLWGAPLVFTTPNVADTKHAMVKLLYEGEEIAAWRLLEEDDPDLGQKEEMLRRVAEDPFAQAVFSDLMIRLYLEHCVGVNVDFREGLSDNACARLMTPGLFGLVQAFFGPVETQGRGGLHAHVSVWIKNFMGGWIIDKLRNGSLGKEEKDEMDAKLRSWRNAVLEASGRCSLSAWRSSQDRWVCSPKIWILYHCQRIGRQLPSWTVRSSRQMLKCFELLFNLFRPRARKASRFTCPGETTRHVVLLGNVLLPFFKVKNRGPQTHRRSSPPGGACRDSW